MKKGKPVMDFVDEDEGGQAAPENGDIDLAAKAPQEAQMDEEDVFCGDGAGEEGKGWSEGWGKASEG